MRSFQDITSVVLHFTIFLESENMTIINVKSNQKVNIMLDYNNFAISAKIPGQMIDYAKNRIWATPDHVIIWFPCQKSSSHNSSLSKAESEKKKKKTWGQVRRAFNYRIVGTLQRFLFYLVCPKLSGAHSCPSFPLFLKLGN